MRLFPFIFSLLALLITGLRCSLKTNPPWVTITVKSDLRSPGIAPRSPDLASLSCFGIVVGGAPNAVGTAEVDFRDPACLKLEGAFYGPYTYSEITSGAVQISLPQGAYQFSLNGYYRAGGCGNTLAEFYPSGSEAVETYLIAPPTTIDLATTTSASLSSTGYSTANTNFTPACPPAAFSCAGALACDTFTGTMNTQISSHTMNVGSGWTPLNLPNPILFNNSALLIRNSPPSFGQIYTNVSNRDVLVRGRLMLADGNSETEIGVMLRQSGSGDLAAATIWRDNINHVCELRLSETIAGVTTVRKSTPLAYGTSKCTTNTFLPAISFTAINNVYSVIYSNFALNYDSASPALAGTNVGAVTAHSGSLATYQLLDEFFAGQAVARRNERGDLPR